MRNTRTYAPSTAACSIERSMAVLGERWTFLILREALAGITRFADFQQRLDVFTDILAARLDKLVTAGVMDRRAYQGAGRAGSGRVRAQTDDHDRGQDPKHAKQ